MKLLQGNQAFAKFLAIATISTATNNDKNVFVSARIGGTSSSASSQKQHLRKAPTKKGYDPTAPVESNTVGVEFTQPLRNRKVVIPEGPSHRIRNAAVPINEDDVDCYNDLDTGVLICGSSSSSADSSSGTPSGTPSRTAPLSDSASTSPATKRTKPVDLPKEDENESAGREIRCRIKPLHDVDSKLMNADQFLSEMDVEFYGITYDSHTRTVVCDNDDCQNLVFENCNMKCNGESSCFNSRIHDADKVECNAYESCSNAHIDSNHVSCNAERSCQGAYIGDNQFTYTLDCLAHEACAWATTSQVNDVHCVGPAACYGAYLGGVNSQVTCQSLYTLRQEGHYSPTCGGDKAFIEAAEDKNINVMCNGDFSCIGYGHDPYDDSVEHPIYFDVDVGRKGELVCEGSLAGNHDGGTYVCRYIDIIQGCGNYECHEPAFFIETSDYRTCNHIFSIHHHELCYEGPGGHVVADDDDDVDEDDEDENNDEVEAEDDEDSITDIISDTTTTNDDVDSQEMTQHFYTSTVKLIYDPYGIEDEDDDDFETDDDALVIDEVGLIEVPSEMMRDLFHRHVVNKVI